MTKVLMFGWEFPPFISGGLGTACYGLTTSMKKLGTEVHFVLPTFGTHEMTVSEIPLINASEVEIPNRVIVNEEIIKYKHAPYIPKKIEINYNVEDVDGALSEFQEISQNFNIVENILSAFDNSSAGIFTASGTCCFSNFSAERMSIIFTAMFCCCLSSICCLVIGCFIKLRNFFCKKII